MWWYWSYSLAVIICDWNGYLTSKPITLSYKVRISFLNIGSTKERQIANSSRESASLWDIPNNRDMNVHERLAQGSRSMPCLLSNHKFVNLGESVLIINEMVHIVYDTVNSISFDYAKLILV